VLSEKFSGFPDMFCFFIISCALLEFRKAFKTAAWSIGPNPNSDFAKKRQIFSHIRRYTSWYAATLA